MKNTKSIGVEQRQKKVETQSIGTARIESFRFGDASVKVGELHVNTWVCTVDDAVIGFVLYSPEYRFRTEGNGKDYGYKGFRCTKLDDAEHHPATEINKYSSLRNAVRAVVACHFSGKQYTYIHDNIVILDGKVVPESVFNGRKVIKPVLAG